MKDFEKLLKSIENLSVWMQLISGSSASFSLAIVCNIITGQPFIFCLGFALCPCLLSEGIIRKFFPTWIGQVVFWTARKEADKDRQKSIRKILVGLLSVLVLSFVSFTVFCSVYAVPFLQQFTTGISPIWSVFLGGIAVLSTFITLFCFTFEEVHEESKRIEKAAIVEAERIEQERIEAERQAQIEKKRLEAEKAQLLKVQQENARKERIEREKRIEQERKERIEAERIEAKRLANEQRLKQQEEDRKSRERIEIARLEQERIERKEKETLQRAEAFRKKVEQDRIEADKARQKEIKTVVSFPKKVAPTIKTKRVGQPNIKPVQPNQTEADRIRKLKDKTKKQYRRKLDLSLSEKSRQSNSDKFDLSVKECVEAGLSVATNDKDKTILITKK